MLRTGLLITLSTRDVDSDIDHVWRKREQGWISSYLSDGSCDKRDGEEDGGTHVCCCGCGCGWVGLMGIKRVSRERFLFLSDRTSDDDDMESNKYSQWQYRNDCEFMTMNKKAEVVAEETRV